MNTRQVIDQSLFDEAVRIGNQSVSQANRQMQINRIAVDAIVEALELIKTGRIMHARARLDGALVKITRMSKT